MPPPQAPQQAGNDQQDRMVALLTDIKNDIRRTSTGGKGGAATALGGKGPIDMIKRTAGAILTEALRPVLRILDGVIKLLTLLVMPFTNLLLPLILPILYILGPIVKLVNLMMRPVLMAMMDAAKKSKPMMAEAAGMMKGGDLIGGALKMGEAVMPIFQALIDEGSKVLGKIFEFAKEAIGKMMPGSLLEFITAPVGAIFGFLGIAADAASDLAAFLGEFAGTAGDVIVKLFDFGKEKFSNLITFLGEFAGTAGDVIVKLFDFGKEKFSNLITFLGEFAGGVIGILEKLGITRMLFSELKKFLDNPIGQIFSRIGLIAFSVAKLLDFLVNPVNAILTKLGLPKLSFTGLVEFLAAPTKHILSFLQGGLGAIFGGAKLGDIMEDALKKTPSASAGITSGGQITASMFEILSNDFKRFDDAVKRFDEASKRMTANVVITLRDSSGNSLGRHEVQAAAGGSNVNVLSV